MVTEYSRTILKHHQTNVCCALVLLCLHAEFRVSDTTQIRISSLQFITGICHCENDAFFSSKTHDVFILNYSSHRLSAQVRCECRQNLQLAERLLRYTSYIILSCAILLEKHYEYEDEPDHSEDKRMAADKSTAATGLPFGIEGCTGGEK